MKWFSTSAQRAAAMGDAPLRQHVQHDLLYNGVFESVYVDELERRQQQPRRPVAGNPTERIDMEVEPIAVALALFYGAVLIALFIGAALRIMDQREVQRHAAQHRAFDLAAF